MPEWFPWQHLSKYKYEQSDGKCEKNESARVNCISYYQTLVLNYMESFCLLWYMITMSNEYLYQAYHVINCK